MSGSSRKARKSEVVAIEASAVEITYEEPRSRIHATNWACWGRKGGLATLERYGRTWFVHLARRRWRKVTAAELARVRESLRPAARESGHAAVGTTTASGSHGCAPGGRREPLPRPGSRGEVDDVDAWHRRVFASGHPVFEPLQERPWGLRDFRIVDPDGYYLRVTSRR